MEKHERLRCKAELIQEAEKSGLTANFSERLDIILDNNRRMNKDKVYISAYFTVEELDTYKDIILLLLKEKGVEILPKDERIPNRNLIICNLVKDKSQLKEQFKYILDITKYIAAVLSA